MNMKRTLLFSVLFFLVAAPSLQAEFRQIDLSIFGMD
jgi:hypothetical protein